MRFESLKAEHLPLMAEIEAEAFDGPWTVGTFELELEEENAY